MRRLITLAALFLFTSSSLFAGDLNWQNYEKVKKHVLPSQKEIGFMEINWRPTFWEAVREAREKDRPILLWTMNGHPLGRT